MMAIIAVLAKIYYVDLRSTRTVAVERNGTACDVKDTK